MNVSSVKTALRSDEWSLTLLKQFCKHVQERHYKKLVIISLSLCSRQEVYDPCIVLLEEATGDWVDDVNSQAIFFVCIWYLSFFICLSFQLYIFLFQTRDLWSMHFVLRKPLETRWMTWTVGPFLCLHHTISTLKEQSRILSQAYQLWFKYAFMNKKIEK